MAPERFMTHLAIREAPLGEGPGTEWGELVTDDEYRSAPTERSR